MMSKTQVRHTVSIKISLYNANAPLSPTVHRSKCR